jgi:hypothetical protein
VVPPEITFSLIGLDARGQARIRGALRRIPDSGDGSWPDRVDHVDVVRLLTGGLSGAVTAQVVAHRGLQQVVHVVKVDDAASLRREWHAYTRHVKPVANALCAPIIAATPEVVAREDDTAHAGDSAIVYDHVGQYAGEPASELRTLEEVARTALSGGREEVDDAVELIRTLFTGIAPVLHDRYEVIPTPRSLRLANLELGANVTLRVENAAQPRITQALRPDDEVLQHTLKGLPDTDLQVGGLLAMSGLRRKSPGDPMILRGDAVVVRLDPSSRFEPPDAPAITVFGTVISTRGAVHRARWTPFLDDQPHADPFDALPSVLTDAVPGRVRSVAHGDLNPRNVVVAGKRPFLIDYAHTSAGRAQQEDFCRLELGLLRGAVGELGTAALFDLQRVLGMGMVGLSGGVDARDVGAACLRVLPDTLGNAFELLWAVRVQAHRRHPGGSAEPWAPAYLRQLLLSAHRTAKWDTAEQTAVKTAASAVAASVITEWITEANPFRYWRTAMVDRVMTEAPVLLPWGSDRAAELYALLVVVAGELEVDSLDRAVVDHRSGMAVQRCAATSTRVIADLNDDHLQHVDLELVQARLSEEDHAVLVGERGIGKSSTAAEFVYRLATEVRDGKAGCRVPLLLKGIPEDFLGATRDAGFGRAAGCALALGAVVLVVDDFDPASGLEWLERVRKTYPRIGVVVCTRDLETDIADFTTIRLHGADAAGVRMFLHNKLTAQGHHSFGIDHLVASLVDDPVWQRAGLHRPAVLSALVNRIGRDGDLLRLPNPYELVFHGLPRDADSHTYCTSLAESLLDSGEAPVDPSSSAPGLIASGLLVDRGGRIDFEEEVHRDYFAALALHRAPDRLGERLSDDRWAAAGLVFATLPGVSADTVLRAAEEISPRSVVYAAKLLKAAGVHFPGFVDRGVRTARSEESTAAEKADVVAALGELGDEASVTALSSIAEDGRCADSARIQALSALLRSWRSTHSRAHRRAVTRALSAAVLTMLSDDNSTAVRERALDVIAQARLTGLELVVSRLVDSDGPWTLTRRACIALRAVGTVLPTEVVDTYETAGREAVEELEARLRNATTIGDAQSAHREIVSVVETLSWAGSREWLLRRRFAFGLRDVVDRLVDPHLPRGTDRLEDLHALLDHSDAAVANEAAHRLLRDHPDQAGEIARCTGTTASTARLLISAAAARMLDDRGEQLFRTLLEAARGDQLEPLADLLCSIFESDHRTGVLLAATAAISLADRAVPERLVWPWNAAMARCRGSEVELDHLLAEVPPPVDLVIEALAGRNFFRTGRPAPAHEFSERARQVLLAHRPATTIDQVQWIRAVAAAGAVKALPRVIELISVLAGQVVSRGGVERPAVTDALAVAGYLARRLEDADPTSTRIDEVRSLLLGRPWPGSEDGRAAGLHHLDGTLTW